MDLGKPVRRVEHVVVPEAGLRSMPSGEQAPGVEDDRLPDARPPIRNVENKMSWQEIARWFV